MSNLKRRRIKQSVLESDKESLLGVGTITTYKPTNLQYATDKLSALMTDMVAKQNASFTAKGVFESLADAAQDAEQAFHEAMVGMRKQVVAQFGDDSPEVRLIGMKRRSDYKKPTRKKEKAKT